MLNKETPDKIELPQVKELAKIVFYGEDNISARPVKGGKWEICYTNDYPMQHGSGEKYVLPAKVVEMCLANIGQEDAVSDTTKMPKEPSVGTQTPDEVREKIEKEAEKHIERIQVSSASIDKMRDIHKMLSFKTGAEYGYALALSELERERKEVERWKGLFFELRDNCINLK